MNCKNHIRGGELQRVVEWHFNELMGANRMTLFAGDIIPTRGLMAGENFGVEVGFEVVATFRKPAA